MKKLLLVLGVAGALFTGAAAPAADSDDSLSRTITEKIVLYIPNRILDALDIFSVNVGVGPIVEAQMMGSRAVWGGAGCGLVWKAYKGFGRQYGFCEEQGWYWSFVTVSEENWGVTRSTSLVKKYTEMRAGFPQPDTRAYGFEFPWNSGPRDYWQIGGSLGFLVDADLYIHPLEWFDLALGVFCIDFTGDDLTFNSFQ